MRIIGGGDCLNELKHLAIDLGISAYGHFGPPMPLDSIPEQLRQADVGIVLQQGLFGELAFPAKVGDYMAVGLPAIVSATTITHEYFTEELIAFIPPGDDMPLAAQVRRFYTKYAYGHRLIDNGRRFVQMKNWTQERAHYLEVVARLVSSQS